MDVMGSQIVWFWRDGEGRAKLPEPAIVSKVHADKLVDLWVFCHHGAQRVETKVPIRENADPKIRYPVPFQPLTRYATREFGPPLPTDTTKPEKVEEIA